MAGMLPGVECARRRRLHQTVGLSDSQNVIPNGSTRRSSFCLYASNNESHLPSMVASQRGILNWSNQDDRLGLEARVAKERLDERLRAQRKSETTRQNNNVGVGYGYGNLRTELFGIKRSSFGSKRFDWARLRWKAMDQQECAICLERFNTGEGLVNLPCAHRFHTKCLVPWLESNSHCPCCRMEVSAS